MVANVEDFLIQYKRLEELFVDPDYDKEIIHCDLDHLRGALIISDDVRVYNLCSFFGIRHIGTSYSKISNLDDVKEILDEDYVTVLVVDVELIDDSFNTEEAHDYAKSINKVFHAYGHDNNRRLLRNVNVYRSVDKYFC